MKEIAYLSDETMERIAGLIASKILKSKKEVRVPETAMSPNDAGKMIGKSANAVRMMCRRGQLSFIKRGRGLLIKMSTIQDYIKNVKN